MKNKLLLIIILFFISIKNYAQKIDIKEDNGKYGFFLNDKKVTDYKYDIVSKKQYSGFYLVCIKKQWGIVNPRGEEVVECKYDTLISLIGSKHIALLNGKFGAIDTLGNILIKFEFDAIDYINENSEAVVRVQQRWALLKKDGSLDFNPENLVFYLPEKLPLFQPNQKDKGNYAQLKKDSYQRLREFMEKETVYPKEARIKGTEGTVVVSFIITKKGEVTNIEVLRNIGDGCGEAAIEVVKATKKWTPAEQDGKKVACKLNMPVVFKLKN